MAKYLLSIRLRVLNKVNILGMSWNVEEIMAETKWYQSSCNLKAKDTIQQFNKDEYKASLTNLLLLN